MTSARRRRASPRSRAATGRTRSRSRRAATARIVRRGARAPRARRTASSAGRRRPARWVAGGEAARSRTCDPDAIDDVANPRRPARGRHDGRPRLRIGDGSRQRRHAVLDADARRAASRPAPCSAASMRAASATSATCCLICGWCGSRRRSSTTDRTPATVRAASSAGCASRRRGRSRAASPRRAATLTPSVVVESGSSAMSVALTPLRMSASLSAAAGGSVPNGSGTFCCDDPVHPAASSAATSASPATRSPHVAPR